MNKAIVDLWAQIGSESYWADLLKRFPGDFVPFAERWPQPGFIGDDYFESPQRVVLMGQNPRASNTAAASAGDQEMFRLIRNHAKIGTNESLTQLFRMTRDFVASWKPAVAANRHLGLQLDSIAYLNLIPLATRGDLILPAFTHAYDMSTKKQLEVLKPDKIVVYGKGAFDRFSELIGKSTQVRYIGQRDYSLAPSVRLWLGMNRSASSTQPQPRAIERRTTARRAETNRHAGTKQGVEMRRTLEPTSGKLVQAKQKRVPRPREGDAMIIGRVIGPFMKSMPARLRRWVDEQNLGLRYPLEDRRIFRSIKVRPGVDLLGLEFLEAGLECFLRDPDRLLDRRLHTELGQDPPTFVGRKWPTKVHWQEEHQGWNFVVNSDSDFSLLTNILSARLADPQWT